MIEDRLDDLDNRLKKFEKPHTPGETAVLVVFVYSLIALAVWSIFMLVEDYQHLKRRVRQLEDVVYLEQSK